MRICVNTRLLLPGRPDGISNFIREALKRITRAHPEHEFVLLFDRPFSKEFLFSDNVVPVVTNLPTRHPLITLFYMECVVPRIVRRFDPDLFLSPDGFLSLTLRIPSLAVIHDLNFAADPTFLPWHIRSMYNLLFPRYARKAERVATVSEFSKSEIQSAYGIDGSRIDVVYNGVNERFHPLDRQTVRIVRRRVSGGDPYFLIVGSIHRRKNLENQVRAFLEMTAAGAGPIRLLIAGEPAWGAGRIARLTRGTDTIRWLGPVSDTELEKLVGAALALCYVSAYEGFGQPPIEAMRAGVPVVTSNTTAIPEICGDNAIQVDPGSVDRIREAMAEVFLNEALRRDLIERGLQRSLRYSWDRTATLLWRSIEQAAQAPSRRN